MEGFKRTEGLVPKWRRREEQGQISTREAGENDQERRRGEGSGGSKRELGAGERRTGVWANEPLQ
jgi:hypothetical protein